MARKIVMTTLVVMLVALASLAEDHKIISPPEFANEGKDDLPFSPAVLAGDTLYVSGQIGMDHSGQIPKDFEAEVKACLDNIGIILKAAGMDDSDVVSAQVYLTDMSLFKRMNVVYASVFKVPRPSRVTVGVSALAVPAAHIEIMVTARRQNAK
jgi:2-iminobutanoate/2-iminopropanoate deaminase